MSSNQFYVIFSIGIISLKMHKMPCLVAGVLGKDGYLLFLLYLILNIIGIILAFVIFKYVNPNIIFKSSSNKILSFFRKILLLLLTFYFLMEALLMYEHIQALFSNALFDNLSWAFFSLLLLFAVSFLAHRGIENIALNYQLYQYVIFGSLLIICILGFAHTDFTVILPLETIKINNVLSQFKTYSCWFGDFFFVLFLGVKSKNIKLSKTILTYTLSMLFFILLSIELVGIYGDYAAIKPGLITVISEQSMLGLNVGRIDWFLILFSEMGAILSCSICLYIANLCSHSVFEKINPIYLKIINSVVLYVFDIFVLIDLNHQVNFFCGFMSKYGLIVLGVSYISLLILAMIGKNKNKLKKGELMLYEADV